MITGYEEGNLQEDKGYIPPRTKEEKEAHHKMINESVDRLLSEVDIAKTEKDTDEDYGDLHNNDTFTYDQGKYIRAEQEKNISVNFYI